MFKALAEGNSIRATGRILGMAKDTLCHWLDRLGPHCKGLHAYLFHDLHLTESLMALLTVLFLWFLRQQEFTLAAFASGLATACRPTGVALIPALAWAYYASNRAQPMPVGRNLLFGAGLLALSVSGLVTYALYLQWRFDDALAFVRVQSSWASWSEGWE